jgi:hypothetical protein
MDSDLVVALRSRGIAVVTPLDANLTSSSDESELIFAARSRCVLYTFNVSDFCRLHREWLSCGQHHAGIVIGPQQRFSIGEQLRRLLLISATLDAEQMFDRIEFLSDWVPK